VTDRGLLLESQTTTTTQELTYNGLGEEVERSTTTEALDDATILPSSFDAVDALRPHRSRR
jgi:hypothetical protein